MKQNPLNMMPNNERECYNKAKSDNARQPQCPVDKEKAIEEALRFFGMIFDAI